MSSGILQCVTGGLGREEKEEQGGGGGDRVLSLTGGTSGSSESKSTTTREKRDPKKKLKGGRTQLTKGEGEGSSAGKAHLSVDRTHVPRIVLFRCSQSRPW